MSDGWRTAPLRDCAKLVRDMVSPSAMEDVPYIGLEHIGENTLHIIGNGVSSDVVSTKAQFRQGDILFGKLRPYFRKIVIAPFHGICSTDILVVRAQAGVDQGFLYYCMASQPFIDFATSISEGTRMPRANWKSVSQYEIPLPPLPQQRAIAHILGALDDKIDLNRRMNHTLEEMASAIFQDWFVNFGPVRAKNGGGGCGGGAYLPPHLWNLFPERLVDSELGEIPEGWEVGCLGDLVSQRKHRVGDSAATVLVVTDGKLVRSDEYFTKRVYSKSTAKYLAVEQWDIAYNPSRINIGSIGMLKEPILGAVSPVYIVSRPTPAYRWYLDFVLRLNQTREWIVTLSTGSVRQALSYQDFISIPCVIPPVQVVQRFDEEYNRILSSSIVKLKGSLTLVALRDALLPKLVSGELRVRTEDRWHSQPPASQELQVEEPLLQVMP